MNKNTNAGLYRIAIDMEFEDGTLDTIVIKDNESALEWVKALESDQTLIRCNIRGQATQEEILQQITFENTFIKALESLS